jgi:hypothetical protein
MVRGTTPHAREAAKAANLMAVPRIGPRVRFAVLNHPVGNFYLGFRLEGAVTASLRRQGDGPRHGVGFGAIRSSRALGKSRGKDERMSSDSLAIYLRDHLAGAAAVDLLELLRDQYAGEPLGEFAEEILGDVEADRAALATLAQRVGGEPGVLKDATAWIGAKVARLKLGRHVAGSLGTFEALETLALGILGKLSLWRALVLVAPYDVRLAGVDFGRLAARAETQHDRVEERRLEAARPALGDEVD